MDYVRFFYTSLLFISIILGVFLIRYSNVRPSMPGAKYFILGLYATIIYSGTYIGEINSSTFSSAILWFHLEHLAFPIQQYFWTMMCLDYLCINKKYQNILKYVMLYHPLLYYAMYYTNNFHHLYISSYAFESNGYFSVIVTTKGIMYTVSAVSVTILVAMTTFLYIHASIKASRLQRHGYIVMIVASLLPWCTLFSIATNNNYLGIDYYPVLSSLSCVICVYGIFRFSLFNTIPIATEIVFRQSKDGIILVDLMNRIIDINDVAIRLYPEMKKLSKNTNLASFVENYPEYGGILDGKEKIEDLYTYNQIERNYTATVTKIIANNNMQIGMIITISDVTSQYKKQKKLETIATNAIDKAEINEISFLQAQIKPHFINNTLSVIASMVTRAPDEARELITDLSDYLENCYYFDSESSMGLLEKEIEAVMTYVNIEKARFRERLKFQIVAQQIPQVFIPKLVLQPLVENAIRHGILKKAEGGCVDLIIECKTDKICFEIRDNGVGMTDEMAASLTVEDYKRGGIGIINIHKRLMKYFKEGLSVKSEINQGTSVTFSIGYTDNTSTEGGIN